MNINYLAKRAALFLAMGSVMFLLSCNDDDEEPSLPDAPVAAFETSVDGATVTITNNSTGEIDSYAWSFGDGATNNVENPDPKTYTAAGEYTITLTVTNEGGNDTASETVTISESAVDNEAPVITILGEETVVVEVGGTYEDAGATATDNVDMDVTANITSEGTVDTSTRGIYTITYTVSDAAGNEATAVRTVIVNFGGLVLNGDFELAVDTEWFVNFGDGTVPVDANEGNTFFIVNIETPGASGAFEVNLSQLVSLEMGKNYKLSFDASSDVERSIVAGLGLNDEPFSSSTEIVDLTTSTLRYELILTTDFMQGDIDNRVLFDLAGEAGVVVLDNIFLEETDEEPGGDLAAPTDAPATPPDRAAEDVVSIYGEAYGTALGLTNVTYDDPTNFVEETIADNNVLKVDFDGFMGSTLGTVADASGMTHFHMDFWISDDFAAGQIFNPKWSNHVGGAGETSSFEYTKAIGDTEVQTWVSLDIPISDFATGDNTQRGDLAEFLISVAGMIDRAYLDNIYFYDDGSGTGGGGGGTGNAPADAPATPPDRAAEDVVSIYGEAYGTALGLSNVSYDDPTNFVEESIAGNNVLKVDFDGFMGSTLGSVADASGMSHFHMDFWIADDFSAGQIFNPKWSNHAGGAGETSSFEYTKAIGATEVQTWVSLDIPISDFATGDNTQRAELAEFLISVAGLIDVAYLDNIYFYDDGTGGGDGGGDSGGDAAAPTDAPATPPARDAANVISIYGEAYGTAIGISNVSYDDPTNFAEESIAGNNVLKIDFDVFVGSTLGSVVDASEMTNFHMDFWVSDDWAAGQIFNPKWSNHAGGAGETSAFEYTKALGDTETQTWISLDIPISDFASGDNTQRAELTEFLISVAGLIDVAYVDNIYFYKE